MPYCANRAAYDELLHMQGWSDHEHLRCRLQEDYQYYLELDNHWQVLGSFSDIQGTRNGAVGRHLDYIKSLIQ